ncbi:Uncharacterized conserved protein, DUF885 familyt [Catalinimonas alkaloidigena]|uniref:Uncharacterized conserved protein, DUF885 familyt n=1 Tax=Catalinimonas alkaloidigena TaxID=1075417 RepID=A0A1G9BBU2_9BACT|nr:DUF885 domain-containing protein [Catalinimonas alkaloidigena]SDK36941.1 Uncharacterized conserved protein, DUF885 familyt [Catalinimonas alkaloidigena]
MSYFKRNCFVPTLAGLVALLALCQCSSPTPQERPVRYDIRFDSLKNHMVEALWDLNPTSALWAGRHEHDSLLTIPTPQFRKKEAAFYARWHDSLAAYPVDSLSTQNQIDYYILQDLIASEVWYADTFQAYTWNPATWNVGGSFAEILNGRYDARDTRLRAIANRLQYVPAYYATARATLGTPTLPHTELGILQNQGALTAVFGPAMVDSLAASGLTDEEKGQFQARLDSARHAIEAYIAFLKETQTRLTPASAKSFRIGPEPFRRKFALDIVSRYTADEVYQKALDRKAYLHHHMDSLANLLWPKYFSGQTPPTDSLQKIRRVIDAVAQTHTDRDAFVETVRQQIPELIAFVDQHDLLTQDPEKPLVVRETPLYMRGGGAGASVSAPGPYDPTADTYYNVTPLDDYDAAGAESYLREYNQYTLQILNIHEAIPGHYTQLVYSNKSPSIIKSLFGNGAMVEGWAVYSELMMLEEGYENSPEMWLMYDKWNLRVTTNAILDHLVQTTDFSEQEAYDFLIGEAFQERAEAEGKWRRARLSQVQLSSYFTGFTEIYALREELKQRMGDDFDLKAFHEEFLSYGSAPVKYIRQLMLENHPASK